MQNVILPGDFKARYSKLLGHENKEFLKYCQMPLRRAIRVNTLKIRPEKLVARLEKQGYILTPIPWMAGKDGETTAYWIGRKEIITTALGNTEEHFLGYFYIQEASSMIPP